MSQQKVGGTFEGISTGRIMVIPGSEMQHQYSRVINNKTSNTGIHNIHGCQNNTSSSRQICGLNPNNAGLFECSFFWGWGQFEPSSYFKKN